MMSKSDAHAIAYDDYVRALKLDPTDAIALDGLARTALLTSRSQDALSWVKSLTRDRPSVAAQIATSKLLAAAGLKADAVDAAKPACDARPAVAAACEQLASIYADAGDKAQLDPVVQTLRSIAPDAPATSYYAAASAFIGGDAQAALEQAQRAIRSDASYAAAYDMAGAAHTKLGQPEQARQAFLTSLRLAPHDSTAYTNLGLIELAAGNRDAATDYFAEALWLTPDSQAARDGLARARR